VGVLEVDDPAGQAVVGLAALVPAVCGLFVATGVGPGAGPARRRLGRSRRERPAALALAAGRRPAGTLVAALGLAPLVAAGGLGPLVVAALFLAAVVFSSHGGPAVLDADFA